MTRNLFEYHPVIGYRYIPGICARVRHESGGYLVACNTAGFRCRHEVTPQPPPGTFRILLFGDSYTAGDGVNQDQRYGDRLEAALDRAQVLNFGLPGSGTDQQFLAFREYAAALEYHLLLICPMVENIRRIQDTHQVVLSITAGELVRRAKPYFERVDGTLELRHSPVPKTVLPVTSDAGRPDDGPGLRGWLRRHPQVHCLLQRLRDVRDPIEYEQADSPGWLLMRTILVEWIGLARSPVILCPIPTFSHINKCFSAVGYLRRFSEVGAATGAQVIDVLPEFWRLSGERRRRCRFAIDDHPSPLGHEVMARALEPHVRRHLARREEAHDR
jgi:hypothetical protein